MPQIRRLVNGNNNVEGQFDIALALQTMKNQWDVVFVYLLIH